MRCEALEVGYARADVGEEGRVIGEEVQRVLEVVNWIARDEEEMDAGKLDLV